MGTKQNESNYCLYCSLDCKCLDVEPDSIQCVRKLQSELSKTQLIIYKANQLVAEFNNDNKGE